MNKSNPDAILVPIGGLDSHGRPHKWVKRRLDKAIEIWTKNQFIILLSRCTIHKPPIIDKRGFPIDESVAAASYLSQKGIPSKKILLDKNSFDTIGNAFYARVLFTDPLKLKYLVVITSEHHFPRTEVVFRWIFSLKPLAFRYHLDFIKVSDFGFDQSIIALRNKKEKKSLRKTKRNEEKIRTLPELHRWLFTVHSAYAFDGKVKRLKGKVLKTY